MLASRGALMSSCHTSETDLNKVVALTFARQRRDMETREGVRRLRQLEEVLLRGGVSHVYARGVHLTVLTSGV